MLSWRFICCKVYSVKCLDTRSCSFVNPLPAIRHHRRFFAVWNHNKPVHRLSASRTDSSVPTYEEQTKQRLGQMPLCENVRHILLADPRLAAHQQLVLCLHWHQNTWGSTFIFKWKTLLLVGTSAVQVNHRCTHYQGRALGVFSLGYPTLVGAKRSTAVLPRGNTQLD